MKKMYISLLALLVSFWTMGQLAFPIDFESSANPTPYVFGDFDGGAGSVVANPQIAGINTSAKVGKMVKSAGQVWGGTSLLMPAPLDFTTNKIFKIKVWSPRANARLLFKAENKDNYTIAYEKEVTVGTANTWVDLTFDFSGIITSNVYSKIVLIFDNGTMGNGSADFTFYFDDIRFEAPPSGALTLPTLPVTFESATVNYDFIDFDGGSSSIIANPQKSGINTSDTVARLVKGAGAIWAGSKLIMNGPIDFSTQKIFRMKVFSPRVGAKVTLKVEGSSPTFEVNAFTTKANEWEDMTFNYSAVPNLAYNQIVIIFDLDVSVGNGSANFTFLVDDIRLEAAGGGGTGTQMNLPVTFDDPAVNYNLIGFEGLVSASIVADPTNPANKVGKMVKGPDGAPWAGATISAPGTPEPGFSSKIPFAEGSTFITIRVWSPDAGVPVLLKAEVHTNPAQSVETITNTTVAGGWETLTFDFSKHRAGTTPINYALNYNKLSIFFNYLVVNATEKTYYFDDIVFGGAPPPPSKTQMDLPVTFDDPTVNYGLVGFGGADASTIETDPTNPSNKVGKVIKGAGAELWAGTSITIAGNPQPGFKTRIPFTDGNAFMNVRVWSPDAGIKVRLKVEDHTDGNKSVETEATTTVANGWQNLVFNFANQAPGTAAINYAFNYNKASIFFNFGVTGAVAGEKTYYFDNVVFGADPLPPPAPLTQMNLPVTFDDPTVLYGLVGFGGADASTIETDPTNPANKVGKVIKGAGAELWAGTSITVPGNPQPGFSSRIPFTEGNAFMTVRVWSPDAGIKVRLKVEDYTDGNKSVETEATTTVANGWQTLVFNFANQAAGTAAINYAFNYNKASIFFNFGVTGAVAGEKTYYFDDVVFGSSPLPVRFLGLQAQQDRNTVVLSWVTTSETQNRGFRVQRSHNGEKWTDIGFVNGMGNSNLTNSYTTRDALPLAGKNYYRLKQEDFDGGFMYSDVKVVDFSGAATENLKLYPNPAENRLNIVSNTFSGPVAYSIMSVEGRQLLSGNLNNTVMPAGVDISKLPAGIYIIVLRDGEKSTTSRFMVK